MKTLFIIGMLLVLLTPTLTLRSRSQALLTSDNNSTVGLTSLDWTLIENDSTVPKGRRGHSATMVGTRILYFGGCKMDIECYSDFLAYDTTDNSWAKITSIGSAPSAREGHIASLVGTKLYIFGGSNTEGFLNDLFVFDLESREWTQLNYDGPKPTARAYHKAAVDNQARIVIFGGITDDGFSDELFILDTVGKKWTKPYTDGAKPLARKGCSMNLVKNSIWIFSGQAEGGVIADLHVLDLSTLTWTKLDTYGTSPAARQGHSSVRHGNQIIIEGGCNHKVGVCFNDTYYLDTTTLWWTKVTLDTDALPQSEYSGMAQSGALIYLFGGCKLFEECYNSVLVFNTSDACPLDCNGNGNCRNERCSCNQGYYGNECSLKMACADNCNDRGVCTISGKCQCFASFHGDTCESVINCPQNCTSADNGVCQTNGTCACAAGFSGEGCETYNASLILECPGNCSGNGNCDTTTGVCTCEPYASGDDCSFVMEEYQESVAISKNQAQLEKVIEDKSLDSLIGNTTTPTTADDDEIPEKEILFNKIENSSRKNATNESSEAEVNVVSHEEAEEVVNQTAQPEPVVNDTKKEEKQETVVAVKQVEEQPAPKANATEPNTTESSESVPKEEEEPIVAASVTVKKNTTEPVVEEPVAEEPVVEEKVTPVEKPEKNITKEQVTQEETPEYVPKSTDNLRRAKVVAEPVVVPVVEIEDETTSEDFSQALMKTQMFGNPSELEFKTQKNLTREENKDESCPNACSNNGICYQDQCFCEGGYVSSDCSVLSSEITDDGMTYEQLLNSTIGTYLAGILLGHLFILYLMRKSEEQEFMSIKPLTDDLVN